MTPEETEKYLIRIMGNLFFKSLIPGESWGIVTFCDKIQIRHVCNEGGYPNICYPYRYCQHIPPAGMLKTYLLLGGKETALD